MPRPSRPRQACFRPPRRAAPSHPGFSARRAGRRWRIGGTSAWWTRPGRPGPAGQRPIAVHGVGGGAGRRGELPGFVFRACGHQELLLSVMAMAAWKCGRRVCHPARFWSRPAGRAAQPFPAAVLDLDPGPAGVFGGELDLDLGRVGAVPPEVPQVGQPGRRAPDRHLPPSCSVRRACLVDPPGAGLVARRCRRLARLRCDPPPPRGDP